MAVSWTVTFDCTSAPVLAAFWTTALGYVPAAPPRGFADWETWYRAFDVTDEERDGLAAIEDPDGVGPRISFLKVPEGKTVKNRVHLDVQIGGGRAVPITTRWPRVLEKVEQLRAAGGSVLLEVPLDDGTPDHVLMADPEGNEFCVI